MDKWDLVVTHPYTLTALGLSLLFYFVAARRREWRESRLMNYIFGVLAAGVLVGGLVLARREIQKPRPAPNVEPRIGVPAKPPAPPPARPTAKSRQRAAIPAPKPGVEEPAAPPEQKEKIPEEK